MTSTNPSALDDRNHAAGLAVLAWMLEKPESRDEDDVAYLINEYGENATSVLLTALVYATTQLRRERTLEENKEEARRLATENYVYVA